VVNVFIRQLTGIRLIAAVWVLLYHSQGPLDTIGLMSIPILPDFIRIGRLGVDLFFALSGFILAHTYLNSLGEQLKAKKSIRFWWLRLARIYPVHLVMLFVAGFAIVAQSIVTGEELNRSWLTPWDFIKNLLLIQEWGGDPQRGWNFVAWSLSMEWLAYLLFPFMALVLWRMHKHLPHLGPVLFLATHTHPAGNLRFGNVRPLLHRQLGFHLSSSHGVYRRRTFIFDC